MSYDAFVAGKVATCAASGFDAPVVVGGLYPHQVDLVRWACRRGRAAIFADTGLGKTAMQLVWAQMVADASGGRVIIVAPLAVAAQTIREGARIGVAVSADAGARVQIVNYDRMHKIDPSDYAGVVLDESSILKSYSGATRDALIRAFSTTPYRLACTATPAPNDWTELGNHAEFLGVCTRAEMLATYFCHDGGETSVWRLKGHARADFWRWVAQWGAVVRRPSDLGHPDAGYGLPPIQWHDHVVPMDETQAHAAGMLFVGAAIGLSEQRAARKATIPARVAMAAEVITAEPGEPWLVWCERNDESAMLTNAIDGAVEVTGADDEEVKADRMIAFADGRVRVLVSKPKICGFGMNFQRCARVLFVGPSNSYEATYQAIRRCWRFGQSRDVHVHVVASTADAAVVANYRRKEADAAQMQAAMVAAMRDLVRDAVVGNVRSRDGYGADRPMTVPEWMHAAALSLLAQDRGGV